MRNLLARRKLSWTRIVTSPLPWTAKIHRTVNGKEYAKAAWNMYTAPAFVRNGKRLCDVVADKLQTYVGGDQWKAVAICRQSERTKESKSSQFEKASWAPKRRCLTPNPLDVPVATQQTCVTDAILLNISWRKHLVQKNVVVDLQMMTVSLKSEHYLTYHQLQRSRLGPMTCRMESRLWWPIYLISTIFLNQN